MGTRRIRVELKSNESVLIRDRKEHRETQRRCENKGRDRRVSSGEKAKVVSPPGPPEGINPDVILILNFQPPEP